MNREQTPLDLAINYALHDVHRHAGQFESRFAGLGRALLPERANHQHIIKGSDPFLLCGTSAVFTVNAGLPTTKMLTRIYPQ